MPRGGSSRRVTGRVRLRVALAGTVVAAGAAVGGCTGDDPAAETARGQPGEGAPNVVVVMTDDQDVASMEVMPTVRRELRQRGVEFTNSYVGLSECCPSRATFLTGQHAHNHGVRTSEPPRGGYARLDSSNTLAVWLDRAGYRTAQVGRYLNYYGNSARGGDPREIPPGWDEWHVPVEHTEFQQYGYTLNENGALHGYGADPADYLTDVLARKAVGVVERAAEDEAPFFLWVTPLAPHGEGVLEEIEATRDPRPAPRDHGALSDAPVPRGPAFAEPDTSDKPGVVRRTERLAPGAGPDEALRASHRGRLESLLAVDRLVGELIEALRESGELERTYVVFTSDNGYLLGEHRQVGKHLVYEESVRVPLVVRGPGLPSGARRSTPVQNIDLAPTIVDAAGIRAGLEMDGVSLLPAARGEELAPDRDLLIEYFKSPPFAAVRSADGFVYVEYEAGPVELYDLGRDPAQLQNVAGEPGYAEVEERLAARLEELRDCAGAGCR